jgi:hypothetical protein
VFLYSRLRRACIRVHHEPRFLLLEGARRVILFTFLSSIFMEFKQLEVRDYKNLKDFFEGQQYSLCNYSLLSLIVWSNQRLKTHYAIEDNTLIICNKSADSPADDHLILPISLVDNITPEHLFILV